MDDDLITMTHVCRGWREILVSRSSLWTRLLGFKSFEKTRTYIERSQSSSLEIHIGSEYEMGFDYAFPLVIPHIRRLKSLTIHSPEVKHFHHCHMPLLEKLSLWIEDDMDLDSAFNGELPLLRELRLYGSFTHLPHQNLANLQIATLTLFCGITPLLDFFESAPLLHTISLRYLIPNSSDAPPERIISLRHLKVFTLNLLSIFSPSTLLRHLHIPIGVSLFAEFGSCGGDSPFLHCLPTRSSNFGNLSHITAVNLLLDSYSGCKHLRLIGPSGGLHVHATPEDDWGNSPSYAVDCGILRSLGNIVLSTVQRLVITSYQHPRATEVEECPIFQTLSLLSNLRTLILTSCNNLPFVLSLNPQRNPSNLVLCSDMEELILYIDSPDQFYPKHLIKMARNRATRGAKLSAITLVDLGQHLPEKEVLKLREHVTHVEYRTGGASPDWDDVPGESSGRRMVQWEL